MIVAVRIGDSEPNDDDIEKRRIGEPDADASKIVACVERQLVDTGLETIGRDQWLVRPAIHIGNRRIYELCAKVQIDHDALGGLSVRGIKHMSRNTGHCSYLFKRKPRQPNGGQASV